MHNKSDFEQYLNTFVYLKSFIRSSGLPYPETNRQLGMASFVMNSLNYSIWRCCYLCRRTMIRLVRAMVLYVLLHDSETWKIKPN